MGYEKILYEVKDQIARITFNRPNVLNALNRKTIEELGEVLNAARDDNSVRVLILTGAGEKAFVAGADIGELAAVSPLEGEQLARRGQRILSLIENCGKPVIACINGFALGGGCELALACTLRIASDTARLGQPEVKLGLIPGYGGTQRLPRLIGESRALKLLLTGQIIDANEALGIGLVDEVVPAAQLMEHGRQIAQAIVRMAPLAVSACLEAVSRGADLDLDAALGLETEIFGRLSGTADKAEGTRAFLEKRPPVWTGR